MYSNFSFHKWDIIEKWVELEVEAYGTAYVLTAGRDSLRIRPNSARN